MDAVMEDLMEAFDKRFERLEKGMGKLVETIEGNRLSSIQQFSVLNEKLDEVLLRLPKP